MAKRSKRTYNLAETTVRRVRELSERYGAAPTQDGVVDLAVERLYLALRERAEAEQWAAAGEDPAFKAEHREIERVYGDPEAWPE